MRNLIVDQGNTRTKYGLFVEGQLVWTEVANQRQSGDILKIATNHRAENLIFSTVSSVVDSAEWASMQQHMRCLKLTATTPLPIENAYRTPETLGKDRLAAVIGASYLYPNQNCLVVDAGTCITSDVITADKVYRGGNISPGIRMRYQAMHTFTARLPLVEPQEWQELWGVDTTTALVNGGMLGASLEIEGLVQRLQADYPGIITILTGGDAEVLANRLKCKIFVHLNLVLCGLNEILTHNS